MSSLSLRFGITVRGRGKIETHRVAPRPDLAASGDESARIGTCSNMCDSSLGSHLLRQLNLCKLVDILQHSFAETELSISIAAGAPDLALVCEGKKIVSESILT
jgi:hypothetical protein